MLTAVTVAALLTSCSSSTPRSQEPERIGGSDAVVHERGVVYATRGDEQLRLDACLPREATGPLPSLVILHGGGFNSGDRTESGSAGLCDSAARTGVVAVSIDYRLAPASTYPAQVQDVQSAVEWLRQPAQVQKYSLDPTRIALLGSSAGAILALTAATAGEGRDDTGTRVKAVVSLSGVADLRDSALALGDPSPQAVQLVLTYLGCTSATDCPQAAEASPITHVDPSDPPVLLVNGTDELVPRQQAEAMAAALQEAGVVHREVFVDGDAHGSALLHNDVRRDVSTFLQENL
ncbi:alpha/beta fold hydrolase [Kineococcus sp. TBRC 1896]|uniref:Alpha/beta fold hydrolase n=1 Tax=Kineococcus mangrovi TaxID=1660183 RepID=A0ABV4HXT3_9ACTN